MARPSDWAARHEVERRAVREPEMRSFLSLAKLQVIMRHGGAARCPGPVVVHLTGEVECVSGCEGERWHTDDDVWPCGYASEHLPVGIYMDLRCERCGPAGPGQSCTTG
jgi:hypothetical protein